MNDDHIKEHLNRSDRHFEFHDKVTYIEKQEITVQAGGSVNFGMEERLDSLDSLDSLENLENLDIIQELKNCFYGDEKEARSFLDAIQGLKDVAITELVRQKVKDKIIPVEAAGRRLWTILSKNGLYKASESNWRKNNK